VVNDPPTHADAIVILGGSLENRPAAAAALYNQGLAPRVIYMDVKFEHGPLIGPECSEPELTRKILEKSGVPDSALMRIGHQVGSTWDESQAVRAWVQSNTATKIIIVTDIFHTRRVRWLFNKQLKGLNVHVQVSAVTNPNYGVTNWWQKEEGLISFQNEWVKLPYYWAKY
jgi:uncharacterized SAM-binding protein YcdF (DUF218 family)